MKSLKSKELGLSNFNNTISFYYYQILLSMQLLIKFFAVFILFACSGSQTELSDATTPVSTIDGKYPLNKIKLPKGFAISVYAEVNNARSMAIGTQGTVFVGNRSGDKVYAIVDKNNDFKADEVKVIASGLNMPCGVAFKNGNLYVAEVNRILRFDNIEQNLSNPPKPVVINDKLPTDRHHGWKFIAFGPDDKLYVPVGAPCNVCEKDNKIYASIARMNIDGSGLEVFAHGVRNSVGFDFHPETQELWFTDNGRDMLGDDLPSDELNRAYKAGLHFGFPYCHQGDSPDPEFGKKNVCEQFEKPSQKLGAHVAAIGMRFYTGSQFPDSYKNGIFIALHGSWNRSSKVGYKVAFAKVDKDKVVDYTTFAEGWLEGQDNWGRPADIQPLADGSMLISDDQANVIYRISYTNK
jgi:glucose/arabinose dehydrogenase